MTGSVLEVREAGRGFGGRAALAGVSLALGAGEIVALLGPNGAGKTTLLRAAAGRLRLDSGRVSVMGRDPVADPRARSALGVVPQAIALFPKLTARENLEVLARLCGLRGPAIRRAVDEGLARAALSERADSRLSELSGGMQRRLNIVAGALHAPKLLLADEPTVGVDLEARDSIHRLLRDLSEAGMAVLFSTHDFDQAAEIADRAAFMQGGALLCEGPVAKLIRDAFGDAREVLVRLAQPASQAQKQLLSGAGLCGSDNPCEWSGPLRGGYADVAALEAQLDGGGVHLAEIRVRDPGLGGVYARVVNRSAGGAAARLPGE